MDELQALIEQEKAIIKQEDQITEKPAGVELINKGISQAVVHKISTDEQVQGKMLDTAGKMIDNELTKAENTTEQAKKEAVFNNNKDACDLYGINEKTVPTWVVKTAKAVHGFWYVIWLIIGSVTTAPIVFLCKKIQVIFKRTWGAVLLAILIYLAVVTSPLWIKYIPIK